MIDLQKERGKPFTAIAKGLPGRGAKPINVATIHRWADRGVRGVKLEFAWCGGIKVSSDEAVARFFASLSSRPLAKGPFRTPGQHQRDVQRAHRSLDAIGF